MGLGNPNGVRHLLHTFLGWSQKNVWGRYSTWDYIEIKYFKRLYVLKLNSSDGCCFKSDYKFTNLFGFSIDSLNPLNFDILADFENLGSELGMTFQKLEN